MAVPPSPHPWQCQRWCPLRAVKTLSGGVRPVWWWSGLGQGHIRIAGRAAGAEELVGEGFEVDAGEDGVAVMPHGDHAASRCGVASGVPRMRWSVSTRRRSVSAPRWCWTTARWPPTSHSARPLTSEPIQPRSVCGEPEGPLGVVELFGVLAEDDLGVGVGEQAGGDLGLGGAVGGLGGGVGDLVGDLDVGDAEGPAELLAALHVPHEVAVAGADPQLVGDLQPLRAGADEELLQPARWRS